ncbi:hypothetical protein PPL_06647 [Heterostelium album PN500]|uniref:Uncharacterized protein n=1 Tax=Heterostelium pallidum (strain ATCC 26659 / Pp 5 / PN500) TaxID=670386 RepID=D3BFB4_HETP5|nr:hypothetical protein PPL_06647 [Heterostelium album PN500]EFA79828.1 hypothetical protein PPL_06647 [Heterostelium album PN500]|eukprot:XP_020431949.1 hypothetical protein PPL_06647 [Heterostelium album PN500]
MREQVILDDSVSSTIDWMMFRSIDQFQDYNESKFHSLESGSLESTRNQLEVIKFLVEVARLDVAPSILNLSYNSFQIFKYLYEKIPSTTQIDPSNIRIDMLLSHGNDILI